MNKDLTIVFSSYQSHNLLKKILKKIHLKYKIIIVENSKDMNIKKKLEKKFKNVKLIIPNKNLGLAKSYNLGIKKAKTEYIFLNNPDIEIENKAIKNLIFCAKKIKNFGVISPTYRIEKNYKNYEINSKKKSYNSKLFKKYDIAEVDSIDNNFLIKKSTIKNNLFDENYFLYFETIDFTFNLKKDNKKLFVCKNIKFNHKGSSSLPKKFNKLVMETRSFHFNWSKFYFYKKNFHYLYALKKIFPNLIKSIKKIIFSLIFLNKIQLKLSILELVGLISSMLLMTSFYRPKK